MLHFNSKMNQLGLDMNRRWISPLTTAKIQDAAIMAGPTVLTVIVGVLITQLFNGDELKETSRYEENGQTVIRYD